MNKSDLRNILITGSHRSGSTWVGEVLCACGELENIHEPFNLGNNNKEKTPLRYWFEYVSENDSPERQQQFKQYLKETLDPSLFGLGMKIISHSRGYRDTIRNLKAYRRRKKSPRRKLIKDPIALFSSEWLAKVLNFQVVVLIRHPAAFAESLKAKDWKHDFSHFLAQENLMSECLDDQRHQIISFQKDEQKKADIIEHAILLWNLIYSQVDTFRQKHPDWLFLRHEDLSVQPEEQFSLLFRHLGLPYNEKAKSFLETTVYGSSVDGKTRNASANTQKWKSRLSEEEINRIYQGTSTLAPRFYSDEEW